MNKIRLVIASIIGAVGAGVVSVASATGTLTATDTLPIIEGGIDSLKATLLAFLPVILPVVIVLGILFGAYAWISRAGRGR